MKKGLRKYTDFFEHIDKWINETPIECFISASILGAIVLTVIFVIVGGM